MVTNRDTGVVESELLFGPYEEFIASKGSRSDGTAAYFPLTVTTGHTTQDATGLIYMRGRYYSPMWHRFVNPRKTVYQRSQIPRQRPTSSH